MQIYSKHLVRQVNYQIKRCSKIRSIADTIDGAIEYANRHRCIKPAVYNSQRLKELPIPLTPPLRGNENWRENTPPTSPHTVQQNANDISRQCV